MPLKRKNPGDDLFSRGAAPSVSSALESLTSVFGMGTGVASPLESPGFRVWTRVRLRPTAIVRIATGARTRNLRLSEMLGILPSQRHLVPGQLLRGQALDH